MRSLTTIVLVCLACGCTDTSIGRSPKTETSIRKSEGAENSTDSKLGVNSGAKRESANVDPKSSATGELNSRENTKADVVFGISEFYEQF